MAKKFRCSTCGNIVAIDPSVEVLQCPHCGKKYRNTFYDPTAPKTDMYAPYGAHGYGEFGYYDPYYYGAYGQPYGAQAVGTQPVGAPTAPVAHEDNPLVLGEEVPEDEATTLTDEVEEEDAEYTEEEEKQLAKLKSKKGAHVAMLIFSFALLAGLGLMLYTILPDWIETFKAGFSVDMFKDDEIWYGLFSVLPFVLFGLSVFIIACTQINISNLRLKSLEDDVDRSKQIKSGAAAGFAFVLIFSILTLAYGGLMSIGGLAMVIVKGGADILQTVQTYIGSIYFLEFVVGVIGLTYSAHRIDVAGK